MKTKNAVCIFVLCLLFAAACSEDIAGPPGTGKDTLSITFQDGVEPTAHYFGTRDAVIKDGPAPEFYHGNFGAAPYDTLGVVRLGSRYYERRLLLRMDLLDLSGCSSVLDARLTLRIESDLADSLVLEVYRVTPPLSLPGSWSEGTGGHLAGVSWYEVDGAQPWSTPGGDFQQILLDERTVRADTTVTFSLPGLNVLNWILFPHLNHGIIIKARSPDKERFILVHLRDSATAALRPKLDLLYFKSG